MVQAGNNTWERPPVTGSGRRPPTDNSLWGSARVELPGPVPPGGAGRSPSMSPRRRPRAVTIYQWRMVAGVEWVGDTPQVAVQVRWAGRRDFRAPAAGAGGDVAGQRFAVPGVICANHGKHDWSPGTYRLGSRTSPTACGARTGQPSRPRCARIGVSVGLRWPSRPRPGTYNSNADGAGGGVWFGERAKRAVQVQTAPVCSPTPGLRPPSRSHTRWSRAPATTGRGDDANTSSGTWKAALAHTLGSQNRPQQHWGS